jgi:hypothetical protein
LSHFGRVINREKCVFKQASVDFLGHRVSSKGALPLCGHLPAILNFPQPHLVKQLQEFLGSVNFYRRFLPRAAQFLKLLTDSLRSQLQWTAEMTNFFQAAKSAMVAHLSAEAEICVMVDVSADHVRAALQQKTSASAAWKLVFFLQRSWSQLR